MARNLELDLAAAGGLVRRRTLLELGHSARALKRLVASGRLRVPRRGWLAAATAPAVAVRAIELGGVLGGASALVSYGIWVDDEGPLVVSCAPTASRLPPLGDGERRVWLGTVHPRTAAKAWRVPVVDALLQLAMHAERDSLIASVDSALNKKLLSASEFRRFIQLLPQRLRSIEREVDGKAMSGTETRMRLALVRAGYRVESQVFIPTVGEVDLLVDGWHIIELDSRKHHDGVEQQTVDRRRDGNAGLAGYGHDRFMWAQVRYEIDWCLAVVAARMRDGRPALAPLNMFGGREAS
ncbi:MAG: type IV toxin-antitoxin system AbiEi family antitoxin domain-containing protein [Glaciihabitans sp.]